MNNKYKLFPYITFGGAILMFMVGAGFLGALAWWGISTAIYLFAYEADNKYIENEREKLEKEQAEIMKEVEKWTRLSIELPGCDKTKHGTEERTKATEYYRSKTKPLLERASEIDKKLARLK